jgi:hypothetical protein
VSHPGGAAYTHTGWGKRQPAPEQAVCRRTFTAVAGLAYRDAGALPASIHTWIGSQPSSIAWYQHLPPSVSGTSSGPLNARPAVCQAGGCKGILLLRQRTGQAAMVGAGPLDNNAERDVQHLRKGHAASKGRVRLGFVPQAMQENEQVGARLAPLRRLVFMRL